MRFFNKTFFKFLARFLAIILIVLGILYFVSLLKI